MPRKRLALIVAGAGFGKTSLVAQAVHTMGMNCVWYSLDPSDQDWGLFFSYLAHGLSRISEGFDRDLLQHPLSSLSRQQREKLLTAMLLQLQGGADSHLAIVLDDFHLVHENKDITESLEFLLPRLPGHVHLIICSRELPCLSLSRYRASRQILDIGEAELAFTRSEIHEFYKRAGTPAPAPETVDSLHERTGGWAAALVLSLSSLSFGREAGGALHPFPGGGASTNALHQYIEENFFLSQPEDLKEFMLKTSLLSWLDPEVCDMLPGVGNSLEHLESLSQRHLLTFPMASPEASFRYHHLLREFLQQRLRRTSPPEDIRSLHLVIGDIFEQRGYRQAAMEHYLEARAHDRTCALFSSMVLSDLAEFPFQLFIRAVNSIPADVMRDNPRMLHIKARIAALRGDLHSALRDTRLALELLRTREDTLGIVNCLKDMSFLNYLKGEVRLAHEEMLTLWRTQGMDPWFYGEIGGYLVFFASLLGRFEEAESFHEAALARLTHSQDPRAMVGRAWIGLCHCVRLQLQGDFQACEILAQKSLDELKSLGFDVALPIAYVHAAINSLYLREPEELARRADLGLELAERLGIQDHQYGWLLYVKAASCLDNNDISRAMRLGHQAMEIFQAMENSWGHSTILKLMALIRIARGDLVGAEDSLRKALDLVQGGDMPVWQGILLMELVLLLLLRDDYDQAAALLETNEPIFKSSWFTLCMFWLLRARVLRWQGLPQRAAEEEARAMPLVERYGYRNWVRDFFRPLDEVCSAPSQGTHQTGAAQHPAPPLRINCLGSFLVHVGERAIPPQAWRNSKATRIFQYLTLNSHKGFVPKDFLLELIWPEEDPPLRPNASTWPCTFYASCWSRNWSGGNTPPTYCATATPTDWRSVTRGWWTPWHSPMQWSRRGMRNGPTPPERPRHLFGPNPCILASCCRRKAMNSGSWTTGQVCVPSIWAPWTGSSSCSRGRGNGGIVSCSPRNS